MAHPVTPIAPTMPVAFCAGVSTCPNGATCADAWRSVSVTATVCGELLAPLAVTVIVGVASSILRRSAQMTLLCSYGMTLGMRSC